MWIKLPYGPRNIILSAERAKQKLSGSGGMQVIFNLQLVFVKYTTLDEVYGIDPHVLTRSM